MNKHFLFLLFMLIACMVVSDAEAKKIKYGEYVYYDGKAKKDMPEGLGILHAYVGTAENDGKQVMLWEDLSGIFAPDGIVTDANITFASGWEFKGALKYDVAADGSCVSYTLTDGQLDILNAYPLLAYTPIDGQPGIQKYYPKIKDFFESPYFDLYRADMDGLNSLSKLSIKIEPEHPLAIVRTIRDGKSEVSIQEHRFMLKSSTVFSDSSISPLKLSEVGNYDDWGAHVNWKAAQILGHSAEMKVFSKALGSESMHEAWGVALNLEKFSMSDGSEIILESSENKVLTWNVKTTKWDSFSFVSNNKELKNGIEDYKLLKFQRRFDDGALIYDSQRSGCVIEYANKSKLDGIVEMKAGTLEVTNDRQIKDFDIKEVFANFKNVNSLSAMNIQPYEAKKFDANGKVVDEYKYGMSNTQMKARSEAIAKASDEGAPYVAEQIDVLGEWTWRNPDESGSSYSTYTLKMSKNGQAILTQKTDYYRAMAFLSYTDIISYYVTRYNTVTGEFQLVDNQLSITWGEPTFGKIERTDDGIFVKEGLANKKLDDVYDKIERKELKSPLGMDELMFKMRMKELGKAKLVGASGVQLIWEGGDVSEWRRVGSESESERALKERRAKEGRLVMSEDGKKITEFKQYYEDGEVHYVNNFTTIKYVNGDVFEGEATMGNLNRAGGESICRKILSLPALSDYSIAFVNGTFRTAKGETLKYTDYLTENQINGVADNLDVVAAKIIEIRKAEMEELQKKCQATKAQLLQEGFGAAYVNSMFDQCRIMIGTPRSLIDRAIQLGCHIERHPVAMRESESDDTFYAIHITNYRTGDAAFDGFVRFYWLTSRVNYVGTTMF